MLIEVSAVHPLNIQLWSVVMLFGNEREERETQLLNAYVPIVLSPVGRSMLAREEHPENA